jgi:heme A synthase
MSGLTSKDRKKMNTKILIAGGLFILILLFGYGLSRVGKPYNSILLSIHKLISLGAFAYLIVTIVRLNKLAPLSPLEMSACVVCGVFFLTLIATGGVISAMKNPPEIVRKIHQIVPYVLILANGLTFYQLLIRKLIA